MSIPPTSGITTKIFAGFHINSTLKMYLHQSPIWNQIKMMPHSPHTQNLIKIDYQNKSYIGNFIPEPKITLNSLKEIETTFGTILKSYCPKCPIEELSFCVFPQVFIS